VAEPRRRPALDEKKKGLVLGILSVGCSRRAAARLVGCSPDTIRRTALRDPAFAESIAKAESESEVLCLKNVKEAGKEKKYWRAAAWVLERRYSEDYAARKPGTITVSQVIDLLKQVSDILMDASMAPEVRQRIRRQISALGRTFCLVSGMESEP
jgi:hypothetical protein